VAPRPTDLIVPGPEIVTADGPSRAVWKGHHGGIEAVHVWTIEPGGPTMTHVHTEESWSGLLPRILPKTLQTTLKKSIEEGLAAIQSEAERRARQYAHRRRSPEQRPKARPANATSEPATPARDPSPRRRSTRGPLASGRSSSSYWTSPGRARPDLPYWLRRRHAARWRELVRQSELAANLLGVAVCYVDRDENRRPGDENLTRTRGDCRADQYFAPLTRID
jgi:hypothetical protein